MTLATSEKLTGRQMEILGLIAKGYSNPDICKLLTISINTVKIHVAAILRILGVTNRTEAAFVYQDLLASDAKTEMAARAKAAQRVGCPAIAVVPFTERARIDDGFGVGLVEDLITRLASWRWFPVVAYASSSNYNLQDHTVPQVAAALNVGYIITGGVRRVDTRARINVSLLSVADGETIWSENFDSDLHDLFAVQDDISRKIVARIAPELIATEARATDAPTVSLDAWQHTARALWHLAQRHPTHVAKARVALEAALSIDREYALAWYGQATYHYQLIFEQWSADREADTQAFIGAVQQCARLDPNSATSHMLRGLAKMIGGDGASAYAHLKEAVALNPSLGLAVSLLGQLLGMQGAVEECIATLEEALRLNPSDAATWINASTLALSHFILENYDEGLALAQRAVALKNDSAMPHAALIACLQESDQKNEAGRAATRLLEINPAFRVTPFLNLMRIASPQHLQRIRSALLAAGLPE